MGGANRLESRGWGEVGMYPPHPLPLAPPLLQPLAVTPEDGPFLQCPSSYQAAKALLGLQ